MFSGGLRGADLVVEAGRDAIRGARSQKIRLMSPSQLRRVFVDAFGKVPVAYLTMVRTERMARLLRPTALSVKQIAQKRDGRMPTSRPTSSDRALG